MIGKEYAAVWEVVEVAAEKINIKRATQEVLLLISSLIPLSPSPYLVLIFNVFM